MVTTPRRRPSALAPALLGSALLGCLSLGEPTTPPRHQRVELSRPVRFEYDGRPEMFRELAVVRPRFPFHEVLLSWNADTTERAGVTFEMRVGRGVDGWSPWLHVGEWNTPRPPGAEREFENGEVDVDHFTSEVYWERVQLRVGARFDRQALRGEESTVQRMHLCFTDRDAPAGLEGERPRAREPHAVPSQSQREQDPQLAARICSPTSLAMVLGYAGVRTTPEEVAARAYDASFDLYGNWPRSIQAAYAYGVPGYLTRFASWKPLERELARGHAVVISIAFGEGELAGAPMSSSRGHLLVVCGFDEKGEVIVNDPAARSEAGVRRTYSREELTRAWQGHGGTAYVLEVSPPSDPETGSRGVR